MQKKKEKRRTCGCKTTRLGLFTTGKDKRQITWKEHRLILWAPVKYPTKFFSVS